MKFKILLLFATIWLFSSQSASAQDIHFTQYNMSPLTLNPANIGRFQGTVRIGGIYRNQWSSLTSNEWSTPALYADSPLLRGFRKKDWIGVGLGFFTDKSGVGGLVNSAAQLGAAYHLAVDKKGNSVLTIGAQFGQASRKTDVLAYEFEDGIIASGGTGDLYQDSKSGDQVGKNDALNKNFQDINAGVILTSKLNKKMNMHIGVSMLHLTKPNYSLVSGSGGTTTGGPDTEKLPRRLNIHGQFNVEMNPRWTFNPTFLFQSHSGADEIVLQAMTGYKLKEKEKESIILNFGVGYRMRDAANLLLGMQKGPLQVGFAYDVNVSSLSTFSNYRGGWELAANYIFKIYKPAVVKEKVLCPRF